MFPLMISVQFSSILQIFSSFFITGIQLYNLSTFVFITESKEVCPYLSQVIQVQLTFSGKYISREWFNKNQVQLNFCFLFEHWPR